MTNRRYDAQAQCSVLSTNATETSVSKFYTPLEANKLTFSYLLAFLPSKVIPHTSDWHGNLPGQQWILWTRTEKGNGRSIPVAIMHVAGLNKNCASPPFFVEAAQTVYLSQVLLGFCRGPRLITSLWPGGGLPFPFCFWRVNKFVQAEIIVTELWVYTVTLHYRSYAIQSP